MQRSGRISVYIHSDIPRLHPGANHEIGATAKPVNEFYHTMLPEFSPLPCVGDALQQLRRILGADHWPFKWLLLAFQDKDRRLANMQPQLVRSIGMKEVKKIIHRIHALKVDYGHSASTEGQGPA